MNIKHVYSERLNLISKRRRAGRRVDAGQLADPRLPQWLFGFGRRDELEVKAGALSFVPAAAEPSGSRGPGRCLDALIFGEFGTELEM